MEARDVAADWNVVVTLPEPTFREARKFLRRWGEAHRTGYFHVITLTVDDVESFPAEIAKAIEEKPGTLNILSHIIPAQRTFTFASAEEFEAKARDIAILWAPMLAGKSFHVRLHRRGFKGTLSTAKGKPALERARRRVRQTRWYELARAFGRLVSERGGALAADGRLRDNVIATGGGPGIMEAANRGACDAGAPSIGFNISLPAEQEPNPYSTPELTFRFHYFAMRKMHRAMRANALAVFPGGFGTMDELFEILTLQQTRKAPPMPIVLFGRDYWHRIVDFNALVDKGMIAAEDLALFAVADGPEEGWEAMIRHGLKAHTPPAADIS